ncbi:class I SAM-dependent methyltransferase [Knoellia sp. Soil729]|uniref:class I SAM-dependent methyltransferase n=1 Tax=Knoellia sp. Soil729 TaxID=1736394 RepID=UPI001F379487|nr:class I SAM-dependent methyltransferase [Knoellia sp. Soil729]
MRLRGGGQLDRCLSCGHLHRSLEDAPANHRDAAYGGDPALDAVRTRLTYRWLRAAGRPASVFEIGYGSGALLRRFHDDGAAISGVDPDQLAVDVDPVVTQHGRLWNCAVEEVPDGAVGADLVVGVHVIEHVADPVVTMRKAASLLSRTGGLVLLTPAGDSWGLSTFGSAWWMLEDPTHVRFFTQESLRRLARDAGLVDVRVDRLVLDSISVDLASAVRAWRPPGPAGALASGAVRGAALLTAPVVGGMRLVAPRTRPTLRLTARRPPR